MVVRRGTKTTGRKATAAAPRKAAAAAKKGPDVTVYADKEPTDYHKAFARWIVKEVGYNPDEAGTKRAAFLRGVSIATAARPAFMDSEFLAEWRESTGQAKRGPKPRVEEETRAPRTARKATRGRKADPEPETDEFDDEEFDEEEEGDEFDEEETDEFEEDEDTDDEEDEEEAPPVRRGRPAKKTAAPAKRTAKAAPAKATRRRAAAAADDDDFIF